MKKILAIALVLVLALLLATPVMAAKSKWTELDYNNDGQVDCVYQVVEKNSKKSHSITVTYFDLEWQSLGIEVWTSYNGILVDTFTPYTYDFP